MPASRRRSGVVILALALTLAGCGSGDAKGTGDAKPAVPDGADPVAWVGAFCGGLGDVIAGVGALAQSQSTPQAQKDGLLAFTDGAQRASGRNLYLRSPAKQGSSKLDCW